MKIRKIKSLEIKVYNEVQRAVNAIYKKHNSELIALIAEQIPKGETMISCNGITKINSKKGKAWGFNDKLDEKLNYLSTLQYTKQFHGGFLLPLKIKAKKV